MRVFEEAEVFIENYTYSLLLKTKYADEFIDLITSEDVLRSTLRLSKIHDFIEERMVSYKNSYSSSRPGYYSVSQRYIYHNEFLYVLHNDASLLTKEQEHEMWCELYCALNYCFEFDIEGLAIYFAQSYFLVIEDYADYLPYVLINYLLVSIAIICDKYEKFAKENALVA